MAVQAIQKSVTLVVEKANSAEASQSEPLGLAAPAEGTAVP